MATVRERARELAAWARRMDTALRLMTFGRKEVRSSPHEPLPDLMRRKPQRCYGDPAMKAGWR